MSEIIYTPSDNHSYANCNYINSDVVDKDIDDVDYSKYAEDDSDEEMANLLDY